MCSTKQSRRNDEKLWFDPFSGVDADHIVDLQLGGADQILNMWGLDSSVNRSLGSQINQLIKNLPAGTRVNKVRMVDP